MIVVFDKEYLRDLYETGKTTEKKHRFQPEVVKKYRARIKIFHQGKRSIPD